MNDRRRIEQLQVMLERLGRMPASRDRDHMLRQVRARIVDVESGEQPSPLLALAPEVEVLPAAEKPAPRPARRKPAPPAPVQVGTASLSLVPPAPREGHIDLLLNGGRLSLEDDDEPGDDAGSPWARGLRA